MLARSRFVNYSWLIQMLVDLRTIILGVVSLSFSFHTFFQINLSVLCPLIVSVLSPLMECVSYYV